MTLTLNLRIIQIPILHAYIKSYSQGGVVGKTLKDKKINRKRKDLGSLELIEIPLYYLLLILQCKIMPGLTNNKSKTVS